MNDTSGSASADHAIPLIVIAGATATGKSNVALDVAERVGGEIVNADALQLYKGMDIGTAKTPVSERRGIAHHMFDVLDVTQESSVAEYQREARAAVEEIRDRGNVPIAVGGSGLYVRALTDVMSFPPSNPSVRAHIESWVRDVGAGAAHEKLTEEDPQAAERISAGDERRIVRALEVRKLTGEPYSAYLPTYEFEIEPVVYCAVERERDDLHERVRERVDTMMAAGFLDEVRDLKAQGLEKGHTARQAIGYAQLLAHLKGDLDLAEAVESTVVATRRLVRKQETWFRRDPRLMWLDGRAPEQAASVIEQACVAFMGQDEDA